MPSITTRLSRGADAIAEHDCWAYAAVPALATVLHFDAVVTILAAEGINFGLRLALPVPVSTAWKFVSTSFGGGAQVTGPTSRVALGAFALGLVGQGVLTAGYLGGLDARFRGIDRSFVENVERYFLSFLGFGALLAFLFVPPALFALVGGPLAVVVFGWLVVYVVVGYLVYAAPYVVVIEDVGLVEALGRSASLATAGGAYARFAVGYAVVVAGVSVLGTAVVANTGVLGVLIAVTVLPPVALVFDATTLRFVSDLVGSDEPSVGRPTEPHAEGPTSPSQGTSTGPGRDVSFNHGRDRSDKSVGDERDPSDDQTGDERNPSDDGTE